MSKEIKIKSNGLRNELKEIRNSIDKLTSAMIEIHLAHTNKPYYEETNNSLGVIDPCVCGRSDTADKDRPV
jgi:hypothetical protein